MRLGDIKVYKFGKRWHWRCDRGGQGQCEGGPKHTQFEAFAAGQKHYDEQHRDRDTALREECARRAAESDKEG